MYLVKLQHLQEVNKVFTSLSKYSQKCGPQT